jgi:hypothetical protein
MYAAADGDLLFLRNILLMCQLWGLNIAVLIQKAVPVPVFAYFKATAVDETCLLDVVEATHSRRAASNKGGASAGAVLIQLHVIVGRLEKGSWSFREGLGAHTMCA